MTDIIQKLNEGEVAFKYKKANGEVRDARGTTNLDLIPENDRTTIQNPDTAQTVTYYDLGVMGFRTFRKDAVLTA